MNNSTPYLLREKDALQHFSIGRTKFRSLVANGLLPQPYRLDGCGFWKTSELEKNFDHLIGAANDNDKPVIDSWADVLVDASARPEDT